MIEINLQPGTGRKKPKRGGGGGGGGGASLPKLDLGATFANVRARITEPWVIGGTGVMVLALGAAAALYVFQGRRQAKVDEATQKAVQDSTRFAGILKEREKAEAKRDTVLRSLNLIRAIDDDRFIWPHVMDEVSRALPPYTWLLSLGYTGNGQGQQAVSTMATAAPAPGKKRMVQTVVARDTVRLRLVGNTVDIQAMTRFMKALEASPFLENITLVKTTVIPVNGKEVTEFQLTGTYQQPDSASIKRVPIALSVR